MEFALPPRGERHILVETVKHDEELYLALITDNRPLNIRWKDVEQVEDEDLRQYLLSMKEGIEKGIYDVDQLET